MTETLERAVTIHQPWAWAVAAGHKPVENRTWRPPLEAMGKLIGIHAGLAMPERADIAEVKAAAGFPTDAPCIPAVRGALIGVARLVGVVFERKLEGAWPSYHRLNGASKAILDPLPADLQARIRPWWRGPWGWLLEEAVLLPEPILMRGQQGLWRIPDVVMGPQNTTLAVAHHPGEFAARALEQWRKARETRR